MVSYMRREHRASMRIRIVSACLNGKTPTNASFFRIHFPSRCCYCRLFIKSQRFTSVYMSFLPVRMNGGSVRRLGTRSTSKLASCTLHKDAHAPNVFKTMLKHVHEQRALSMICRSNRRRRRRRKKGIGMKREPNVRIHFVSLAAVGCSILSWIVIAAKTK